MPRPILAQYVAAGWALTHFNTGEKGPKWAGWNTREKAVLDPETAENLDGNVGLLHAYSGTCCIDIDDTGAAIKWLSARGIDLLHLLAAPDAVRIHSGREGSAKLLYASDKVRPTFMLNKLGAGLELRCGTRDGKSVQDVLPPSVHPDTQRPYEWRYGSDSGHWSKLPPLPEQLRELWDRMITPDTKIKAKNKDGIDPIPASLGVLRTMLYRHSPDMEYNEWVHAGMVLHHETGGSINGFDLWDEWSKTGSKYRGRDDLQSHWKSFGRAATPVTMASLRVDEPAEIEEFPIVTEPYAPPSLPTAIGPAGGEPTASKVDPEEARELAKTLQRDKNGRALAVLPNLTVVLGAEAVSGVRLAYDTFQDALLLAPVGTDDWRPLRDTDYTSLRLWLENTVHFHPVSKDLVRDTVIYLAEDNQIDSAIMWLSQLTWDGKPRVDKFFARYFGADSSPYVTAVSRYFWTAAAARVLDPGCQCDMVPILVGRQGIGKSQGVKAIVPDPAHYVELKLDEPDDTIARKMRGALVGELAELRGMRQADIERVRAFVTRTHEKWTPKFKEFATVFPRRLVMVGTSNDDDILTDDENRRWLPMHVHGADVKLIATDREQLWAEGAALYKQHGVLWSDAQIAARDVHAQFEVDDPWEQDITNWLSDMKWPENVKLYDALVHGVGLDNRKLSRGDERRAGKILRGAGYEKKQMRVAGKLQRVWVKQTTEDLLT